LRDFALSASELTHYHAAMPHQLSTLEICAGAGGQALGLEKAGYFHAAAVELDKHAAETLRLNRSKWNVLQQDVREFDPSPYRGIDLFAGGVPCPPFSIAGKQLGPDDDRDLFPTALNIIEAIKPAAIMLENVQGLASARFKSYRRELAGRLERMGYNVDWQVLNACSYGVPQLRPRFILVGLRQKAARHFAWPAPIGTPRTVGPALVDLMAANGWGGAFAWAERANGIGPTLVGGSKLHGGPDLGPTRARESWKQLSVDGRGVANEAPGPDFDVEGMPRLTVRMAARVQGFPDEWQFAGKKTAAYRQIGNAFPPPVAEAVGIAIRDALAGRNVARKGEQSSLALMFA
jgi:DNA (cytosine-5)-methyltransferase 1